MIGKVLRGERPAGLIYYLYGPGRHEEHTDPHIVAGWREPAELEPPLRLGGSRDLRRLTGLLQQPVAALGRRAPARPVWHCAVRAAPGDRMLSDEDWAVVAADVMHRTGLAPLGQDDEAVRWIAIRHAADHIHIVATLARQDGIRPRVSNDFYRVREACLEAETRLGLTGTAPADRTAARRPSRAESEKAVRRGWPEPPRTVLLREVSTAAAAASGDAEFFALLRQAGIDVRHRLSTRTPGEVTGYAVALPADTTRSGEPVWYGGGKLAADLTLPRLRRRWATTPASGGVDAGSLTPSERAAIWEHAARTCANAAGQIRLQAARDPAAAADAACAAADVLHVAARALNSRGLHRAACAYSRAARVPYGRTPRLSQSGRDLRRAARLLSAAGLVAHDPNGTQIALVLRLAALAEAVADLRRVQRHAAQATAARSAAERLHHAARADRLRAHANHGPTSFARIAFPSAAVTPTTGQNQASRTSRVVVHRPCRPPRRAPNSSA